MAHTKKLVYEFNSAKMDPKDAGLYYVCFQVFGQKLTYAFGYAEYDGKGEWLVPSTDCMVYMWCIQPSPQLLF